jgi:hypothetical protein
MLAEVVDSKYQCNHQERLGLYVEHSSNMKRNAPSKKLAWYINFERRQTNLRESHGMGTAMESELGNGKHNSFGKGVNHSSTPD